jgi:hypothetical protein
MGIFHNDPLLNVKIIEKEIFDIALQNRLTCDQLESEMRVKDPMQRGAVLDIWEIDKKSGFENCRTQLAEWTAIAFLEERSKTDGREGDEPRKIDNGRGAFEGIRFEEAGIG